MQIKIKVEAAVMMAKRRNHALSFVRVTVKSTAEK
jgi:hypothetical protein